MKKINLFLALVISATNAIAQTDTSQVLRGFPITDYMVNLNDSTVVVQLEMPENLKLLDKQLGLLWGVYNKDRTEVVQKGYGKCHLIKGFFYYFAISHNESGKNLKPGDLLYTFLPRNNIYDGQIPKLASHFIRLTSVQDKYFYDRYNVFLKWTEQDEKNLIDSLVEDIRFTGKYFLENDPTFNKPVKSGEYEGQKLLDIMIGCELAEVRRFLNYIIARPRLYAGKQWKISEIFATWVTEGAPVVVDDSR